MRLSRLVVIAGAIAVLALAAVVATGAASPHAQKATTMPVALATAATDRSISAQRMTKVSPTAMMPAIEMPVSTFQRLSTVRKDGLANSTRSPVSA